MVLFNTGGTFLTERQAEVLTLRGKGLTQSEVADRLGTTVANISTVEKRARRNLEKAARTLKLAREIEAPLRLSVDEGVDLYDVPGMVYDAADGAGIKVALSGPEILRLLHREAGPRVRDRAVVEPLSISVGSDGSLSVR